MMRYGSVCSGIEAATMAWHPLGWTPVFFSEIEAFPSAVLAHHYGSNMPGEPLAKNGIPNYGDFTTIGPEAGPIDLLVGGTPCQSFSVAGKRLGLDDPRGNLALEYLALARRLRARWIVWENVPGVLSSHTDDEQDEEEEGDDGLESADFATFLSFVQECGYGFAYRVLDAQYVRVDDFARAVPQRRRRVFLVGYLGDWRRAAAVLLEPEGMRGDSAPRREAGQRTAGTIDASAARSRGAGTNPGMIANALRAKSNDPHDDSKGTYVPVAFGGGNTSGSIDVSTALTAHGHRIDFEVETFVAHSLRAEGFDASEDGTGRGTPIVPVKAIAIQERAVSENPDAGPQGAGYSDDGSAYTLEARHHVQAVAFAQNQRDEVRQMDVAGALASEPGMKQQTYLAEGWAVRRLMPIECERLQGFPDNFTNVPWRGKDTAPDGPRYKALGNSMAVNAMRWIGQRIDIMEKLIKAGRIAA